MLVTLLFYRLQAHACPTTACTVSVFPSPPAVKCHRPPIVQSYAACALVYYCAAEKCSNRNVTDTPTPTVTGNWRVKTCSSVNQRPKTNRG
ncbi:hypothetical protein BKA58DRAFT_89914 [Alternaria rosae]|uniref:uncharacterized protein n=1 Tax=Alternaria rosae TaxID=1187941 RepID=UPI001E8EEB69|nr:uncharacterized protein BKA58DRAFT_89914 [Alternaria rosae]KAH6878161.1 hypothetical protein BKA58DRAFT_89914 [Alternaria rosae]